MIKTEAFILDEATVVLNITDVDYILADICKDWVRHGYRGTLRLPTVKKGIFEGYIDEMTKAPIGRFTSDRGAVYELFEDSTEAVSA